MIPFFLKKHQARRRMRGFTLLEVAVSLSVFTLVLASVAQIFGSAFSGYRSTRNVQHDIENVQYTVNVIAKELRTGSVVSASGNQSAIKFYDHSQGKCFLYQISGNVLQATSAGSIGVADCSGQVLPAPVPISTGTVTGSFRVTPSASLGGPPTRIGKVTIALSIAEDATHFAHLQTTISLRDFGNIGL